MSSNKKEVSRRDFLVKGTQVAGLAAVAGLSSCTPDGSTPKPFGKVIGANERINMALIGIRGRGGGHVDEFSKMPNVRVKTLVDIYENLYASRWE